MNFSTNRQACSRDIGKMYAKHQILKYVINGGSWGENNRYIYIMQLITELINTNTINISSHVLPLRTCASSQLQHLAKSDKLQKFMYQDRNNQDKSEKEIYQKGALRLVSS